MMSTRLARVGVALALVAFSGACGGPLKVAKPTCDTFADQVDLGQPVLGWEPAYFTTTGGTIYFSGGYYSYGHPLDFAKEGEGRSTLWIGKAETTPRYHHTGGSGRVENLYKEIEIGDNLHTPEDIPAGRYWIWGFSGDVIVSSCTPDSVDGTPPSSYPKLYDRLGPYEVPLPAQPVSPSASASS